MCSVSRALRVLFEASESGLDDVVEVEEESEGRMEEIREAINPGAGRGAAIVGYVIGWLMKWC